MSHWNHRVFKETTTDPLASENGDWFTIREVYYDNNGDVVGYGLAKNVEGDSIEDLRSILNWMLACLDKPVLVESELKLIDFDDKEE